MTEPLTLTGDARARGLALGEHLRPQIHAVLERVVDALGGPAEIDRFLDATDFLPAISAHTPELLAEVEATAEGAAVPLRHLLVHNLMDEYWWWSATPREACSTLAVPTASPALLGQTMDLDRILDGSQVMVRHRAPGQPAVLVLASAGLIGLCGASSAGFAVCVNALPMLEHSRTGLPVAFVLRGALAASDADAALAFLRTVPHASGQHYAVVGRGATGRLVAAGIECSAFGPVDSATSGAAFGHANHPLASTDIDPSIALLESSSALRQSVLDTATGAVTSLDDLTDLLTAAPVCVPRTETSAWFTFGAIAVELGDTPRMHFALGPPDVSGWTEGEV